MLKMLQQLKADFPQQWELLKDVPENDYKQIGTELQVEAIKQFVDMELKMSGAHNLSIYIANDMRHKKLLDDLWQTFVNDYSRTYEALRLSIILKENPKNESDVIGYLNVAIRLARTILFEGLIALTDFSIKDCFLKSLPFQARVEFEKFLLKANQQDGRSLLAAGIFMFSCVEAEAFLRNNNKDVNINVLVSTAKAVSTRLAEADITRNAHDLLTYLIGENMAFERLLIATGLYLANNKSLTKVELLQQMQEVLETAKDKLTAVLIELAG
ncbi:MAG: hypothetical protein KatS3mg087_1160 [Patescibacteria group bacterium]|nr:MAG: hypothetical protein KatS3mg087_1160 [Patescibacteria group bacterium]